MKTIEVPPEGGGGTHLIQRERHLPVVFPPCKKIAEMCMDLLYESISSMYPEGGGVLVAIR